MLKVTKYKISTLSLPVHCTTHFLFSFIVRTGFHGIHIFSPTQTALQWIFEQNIRQWSPAPSCAEAELKALSEAARSSDGRFYREGRRRFLFNYFFISAK